MSFAPQLTPASTSAQKAKGAKFAVLTAYDYPMARLLEEAGVVVHGQVAQEGVGV